MPTEKQIEELAIQHCGGDKNPVDTLARGWFEAGALIANKEAESEIAALRAECFKAYTYLVFDANGKFCFLLQMQNDKEFEKWNEQTKKEGLETVSIRVYTDNPQTTYGRLADVHLNEPHP